MRVKTLAILVFLGFPAKSYCWWSMEPVLSAHRNITEAVVALLGGTNTYPDIQKFGGTIVGATTTPGNDANAHGRITDAEVGQIGREDAVKFNGGKFGSWWDYANFKYENRNFSGRGYGAYYYAGLMSHLMQDQAVPAHAANIFHAQTWTYSWVPILGTIPSELDDLEAWIGGTGPNDVFRNYLGVDPSVYYYKTDKPLDSIIYQTQLKLGDWRYPLDGENEPWRGRRYWWENGLAQNKYVGQAFFPGGIGGWGSYGGPDGIDMYTHPGLLGAVNESPDIAREQLNAAASHTAGLLMAVSESLPPLITAYSLSAQAVNGPAGTQLLFDIMENRLADVKISLFVRETGQKIVTDGAMKRLSSFQSDQGTEYYAYSPGPVTWADRAEDLYRTNPSDTGLLPRRAVGGQPVPANPREHGRMPRLHGPGRFPEPRQASLNSPGYCGHGGFIATGNRPNWGYRKLLQIKTAS